MGCAVPTAKTGAAIATSIAAITSATVTTNTMRLNIGITLPYIGGYSPKPAP